jgi:hypothetical protein
VARHCYPGLAEARALVADWTPPPAKFITVRLRAENTLPGPIFHPPASKSGAIWLSPRVMAGTISIESMYGRDPEITAQSL